MVDQSEIVLVPGGNIAIWPEVKLGRAYAHMMEIQHRIEEWEALRPLRSKATQVTDSEISITLDVVVAPPLETLATIFGDAIHNLRAALDAVVWEMATFEGAHPADEDAERAVQFPLHADDRKFGNWAKRVGSISDQFLARLEEQQPYKRSAALAQAGQVDTLMALHSMDIVDKHRNSISAVGGVRDFSNATVEVKGDAGKLVTEVQERAPIANGAALLKLTSSEPFSLRRYVGGPITAHFDIPAMGGFAPILDVLGTMAGKVRTTLDGLYGEELRTEGFDTSATIQFAAGKVTTGNG